MPMADVSRSETVTMLGNGLFTNQDRRDRSLYHQVYHLPRQLERARARVRMLENQALRLGLRDLVEAR